MFYNNIDPVFLRIFGLEIRYYGIIYALGFVITYFLVKRLSKEKSLGMKDSDVDSLMLYLILGTLIGSRIGYIVFYNFSYYIQNPLEILALWHGGLSFHGGFVGVIIAVYLFSRKYNMKFLKLADILVIPVSLALAFGRIGNFLNGELYGRITNLPWAVKFKSAEGFRHPSQLYESLKNFIIFFILYNIKNKNMKDGFMLGLFCVMYGILRFFIEFIRVPEIYIGPLTMGQLLSIPVFILGLYLIFRKG